jgi:hypothetical protein
MAVSNSIVAELPPKLLRPNMQLAESRRSPYSMYQHVNTPDSEISTMLNNSIDMDCIFRARPCCGVDYVTPLNIHNVVVVAYSMFPLLRPHWLLRRSAFHCRVGFNGA